MNNVTITVNGFSDNCPIKDYRRILSAASLYYDEQLLKETDENKIDTLIHDSVQINHLMTGAMLAEDRRFS